MAVVPMKRLELFALRRDRKAILELLQRRGVVEVESTQASGEVFRQADTSQAQQELETQARLLEQAVELLDHTVPVKKGMLSFLAGRKPVTWEEYQRQGQEAPALLEQAREILRLGKQVTDSEAQAQRLEAQLETLKPWMALDRPLDAKGTGSTRVILGSFPQALEEGALKAQLAQRLPQVSGMEAEVLSCQAQQTCVFLVCLRQDAAQVEEALRSMGFTYPAVTSPLPPAQQAKALEEEIRGAGIPQPGEALFKGALRALWGFQLFKRHPVLLPAAGPGAGHQRDFHGVQPAGRHAGRRRGGGHLLCGGVPHRPQHEHGHQPAGGLCAHQPAAVCGVLRQVL